VLQILFGVSILDEVEGFDDVDVLLKSLSSEVVSVKEVDGETMLFLPHLNEENALPEMSWVSTSSSGSSGSSV